MQKKIKSENNLYDLHKSGKKTRPRHSSYIRPYNKGSWTMTFSNTAQQYEKTSSQKESNATHSEQWYNSQATQGKGSSFESNLQPLQL